jgi:hypothetical protein
MIREASILLTFDYCCIKRFALLAIEEPEIVRQQKVIFHLTGGTGCDP